MAQKWARSWGGRDTRSFANLAKIDIQRDWSEASGGVPDGSRWLKTSVEWLSLVFGRCFSWFLFIWETFYFADQKFQRPTPLFFILDQDLLDGISEASEMFEELREYSGLALFF